MADDQQGAPRRFFPLRMKLVVLVVPLFVAMGVFLVLYFPSSMERLAERWVEEEASSLVAVLSSLATPGVEFDDDAYLEQLLESFTEAPQAESAAVVLSDGRLAAGWNHTMIPVALLDLPSESQLVVHEDAIYATRRIVPRLSQSDAGDAGARLVLGFSLAELRRQAQENFLRVLTIASLLALVGLIGVFAVGSWLTVPIAALTDGAKRIADGELGVGVPVRGQDEVAELAAAFNHMSAELATTQAQLVHARKLAAIGELASGVAHELNNPLQAVVSYSEQLKEDLAEYDRGNTAVVDDWPTFLELIETGAMRCRTIVKNLLTFSRQTEDMEPTVVDLHSVISFVEDFIGNQLKNMDVDLDVAVAVGTLVKGDSGQLQQVLVNIVLNGAQAMKGGQATNGALSSGGTVTIVASQDASSVTIEVADQGPGIDEDILDRIFDPFFSTKEVGQGTGLGLSISYGIIRAHGGELKAANRPEGGAVFSISLPSASRAESAVFQCVLE